MSGKKPELTFYERTSLEIGRLANGGPFAKKLQHLYHYHFSRNWVMEAVGRRVYVDNIEQVLNLHPDRGVIMAANHRSFYDQWISTLALFERGGLEFWGHKVYFPVRSNFFYERPLGMLVNTAVGAWSMFPPIFRDSGKAEYTREALGRVNEFLADPNAVVGVHPEGTRSKDPDPYKLLPAQPGVGQMVLQGKPVVIPFFINGVGNGPVEVIKNTQLRGSRQKYPVIVVYGEPLDYSDLTEKKPRASLYLKMAKRLNKAIEALMPREQELRAMATAGELPDSAPGWLRPALPWTRGR